MGIGDGGSGSIVYCMVVVPGQKREKGERGEMEKERNFLL